MAFPQAIAVSLALLNIIGLPGNLLVVMVIVLETKFHSMRYVLLASLAMSDFLLLIIVNLPRIASIAIEKWPFGETMCYLHALFARYFYINAVFHLMAVSYDRYSAIVKSPLTYHGMMTKARAAFMVLIWVIPIPFCIGPLLGWGNYDYNPEVFFCQQVWMAQSGLNPWNTGVSVVFFVVPFLVIALLTWPVYKTAKIQANAVVIQIGGLNGSENQQQENSRRLSERKAAVDFTLIIATFLLCFFPSWVVAVCRQLVKGTEISAETELATTSIVIFNSLCNPIIYSIRKREFRSAVKNVFGRIIGCWIILWWLPVVLSLDCNGFLRVTFQKERRILIDCSLVWR